MEHSKNCKDVKDGIAIDMKLIGDELKEQDLIPGAFCQDYEVFKSIYRFMARRLRRTQGSAYLVLLSLLDYDHNFPPFHEREILMKSLSQVIQKSLRLGDVFTQYSSCQFLILIPDTTQQDSDIIATRIHDLFFLEYPNSNHRLLLHHCYPMQPAMPVED